MDTFHYLFFSFIALGLFFPQATASSRDPNKMEINHVNGIIGAIVDNSSRIGKEARVAMEMAINDFNQANQSLVLQNRNSQGDPVGAVLAARDLINTQQVQAILGPHTWEESALIADVGSQAHAPILSLSDSTPQWATMRWPFLLQASPSQHIQMNAVAAIVQSWGWRRVTVIYEDNSAANGVISHLSDALREIGTEINQLLGLPPFTSFSLSEDLEKLKRDQCRVFVVHTSLPLAIRLFRQAKRMEMMGNGYVWITTDSIMSLVHSINASTIDSMQGILGVKSYFPESGPRFQDFNTRFRRKFSTEHPEEENHEPGIFAVQAYNATWAVARALAPALVAETKTWVATNSTENLVSGQEVGFSESVDQTVNNSSSMENLGQEFWPGGPRFSPRGWTPQTSDKPLRIGVPTGSPFKQFVNVAYDDRANTTTYTGFSISIFEATMERLPYFLPYEFFSLHWHI
ncbi:hypothetical protein F0562_010600 [Nyssa sinensis]|uniref:Receptor ligand binding region domain-containing protein n=1 Tax=Nyssa sinensis TaxID=561372 RepID=A0A5J5A0Z9_9ASTE|nr:hypothetical protein F0562_010600 [Nyssa sinensis]